jgi:hypothetical protein
LSNFTQRPDSYNPNVNALWVIQHITEELEEMRKVILETDDDPFEDSKEDIRANFAM